MLLAGALLGAAGFALEQHYYVWHPRVAATSDGWRVSQETGQRPPDYPALAPGLLVWHQGAYVCVLDLASGDDKVINAVGPAVITWPAVASESCVAWVDSPRDGKGPSAIWAYDVERGRRWQVEQVRGAPQLALSGSLLAWIDRSGTRIESADLATGARSVLVRGGRYVEPLLLDEELLAWSTPTPPDSSRDLTMAMAVLDRASGRSSVVGLGPTAPGVSIVDVQLSDGRLLWSTRDDSRGWAVVRLLDVAAGAGQVVTQGRVWGPVLSGDLVVWLDESRGVCRLMARRLDEAGPFAIASVPRGRYQLALDDGVIAWAWVEPAKTALPGFIETTTVAP